MTAPAYALAMAQRSIPTFPCNAEKRPCCKRGFYAATCDIGALHDLWRRSPGPLIGMPTGPASGLDLLDIDPRHGGGDWLAENAGFLGNTLTVTTRSGGTHFFFNHKPGMRNSESKIAPGVDVRGEGGYAILWAGCGGSVTRNLPPANWRDWLADLAMATPSKPPPPPRSAPLRTMKQGKAEEIALGIIGRELFEVESAPPGERHYRARDAARTIGGLIEQLGIPTELAAQKIYEAAQRAGAKNLQNAWKTIMWGLEVGKAEPLTIGRGR